MDREDIIIRDLGEQLAARFGYAGGGADALRFYLMHRGSLSTRKVLAMRPGELLEAYDTLGTVSFKSEALH